LKSKINNTKKGGETKKKKTATTTTTKISVHLANVLDLFLQHPILVLVVVF
jgi:hypothetical protein